jgi:hypothetical protein
MSSLLDRLYARYSNRLLFFKQGWGDTDLLANVSTAALCEMPPARISIAWRAGEKLDGALVRQGSFTSPFTKPGFPEESCTAYLELVLPVEADRDTPVCLHLAATGDEGFVRRRKALALPLAKRGIGSLILENPFYGMRRPPGQHKKMLNHVSDLILMGWAAFTEGRTLLAWLHREGYSRAGVSGISMGGHMAALIGALSPVPVAVAPCIAPHSPSAVFTEGTLRHYCAWEVLDRQRDGRGSALEYMKGLLDIMDIRKFPPPQAPSAAAMIAAYGDAYIPRDSVDKMHGHWPGSSLRWVKSGHVGTFLFHRHLFVETIVQAFDRL